MQNKQRAMRVPFKWLFVSARATSAGAVLISLQTNWHSSKWPVGGRSLQPSPARVEAASSFKFVASLARLPAPAFDEAKAKAHTRRRARKAFNAFIILNKIASVSKLH